MRRCASSTDAPCLTRADGGAASLIPLWIWELLSRPVMTLDAKNLAALFYVAVFPSTLAYLCFNRGVQLIGANRAAPFFHVVPVFGSVMAIAFLGERPTG